MDEKQFAVMAGWLKKMAEAAAEISDNTLALAMLREELQKTREVAEKYFAIKTRTKIGLHPENKTTGTKGFYSMGEWHQLPEKADQDPDNAIDTTDENPWDPPKSETITEFIKNFEHQKIDTERKEVLNKMAANTRWQINFIGTHPPIPFTLQDYHTMQVMMDLLQRIEEATKSNAE